MSLISNLSVIGMLLVSGYAFFIPSVAAEGDLTACNNYGILVVNQINIASHNNTASNSCTAAYQECNQGAGSLGGALEASPFFASYGSS